MQLPCCSHDISALENSSLVCMSLKDSDISLRTLIEVFVLKLQEVAQEDKTAELLGVLLQFTSSGQDGIRHFISQVGFAGLALL